MIWFVVKMDMDDIDVNMDGYERKDWIVFIIVMGDFDILLV